MAEFKTWFRRNINHPPHYTFGEYEVIDVIEDWALSYHLGNVIKYIARSPFKDDEKADLLKAKWYLDRYIYLLYGGTNANDTQETHNQD